MKPLEGAREAFASAREVLLPAVPIALLAIGLLVLAYFWLEPNPPKHVVLATGPARGAYDEIGQRYREALARYGIEVTLLPSQGSADNLQLLQEGSADIEIVQRGSSDNAPATYAGVVQLGRVCIAPLSVF